MPLCRRLGMILDPGSCPDACWQTVFLPALALGPLLGSLAFVAVALAKGCFSGAAWRRVIAVPLLAAVGAIVNSAWNMAEVLRDPAAPAAERAPLSARVSTCILSPFEMQTC